MGPGLNREIGLRAEAYSEYDDCEEASEVARQLPVLPLPRLSRRRRRPVEGETFRPLLVARTGPAARAASSASAGTKRRAEAGPESVRGGREWLERRHYGVEREREEEEGVRAILCLNFRSEYGEQPYDVVCPSSILFCSP